MAIRRILRTGVAALCMAMPGTVSGQVEQAHERGTVRAGGHAEVEALLATSRIRDVIAGLDALYLEHLRVVGLDSLVSTDPELDAAVARAFADSLVYEDVVRFLAARDGGERAARALDALRADALDELDRMPDPDQPLDAFVDGFARRGPPLARVRLMARWAEIQKAGAFYVFMDQAAREAAHTLARRVGATDAEFEPLSREEFADAYQRNMNRAVVAFLWRYQDADDAVVREALEAYGSEDGQWWVQEYTLAVSHAIRRAGLRVAAALDQAHGS